MFPGTIEDSWAGIIFWLFPAGMAFFFPCLRRNGNLVEWGANRQIRLPVAGGRERWRSFSWRIHDAEKLLLSFFMKKCLCLTLLSLLNSSEIMTLYSKSQSVKFFNGFGIRSQRKNLGESCLGVIGNIGIIGDGKIALLPLLSLWSLS